MKRFVTYIYVYEEKKKGNNIGFAKIEIRGEECRIEIHLRGVYAQQTPCVVYLFREDAGKMEGVRIGELHLVNGNGDFATIVKAKHIGESDYEIDEMEGILLLTAENTILMSRWKEGDPLIVSKDNFREWVREYPSQTQVQQQKEKVREEEIALQATEVPAVNLFPEYEWEDVWENLKTNCQLYQPFEDREAVCVQIELKTIRELPKRYWYLGNNSFLLHGFFNYRYIVVGKTGDGRWFIGVPGVYQRQERVMAAIFGFPEFLAAVHEKDEDEVEPINWFGCWCRYIEE